MARASPPLRPAQSWWLLATGTLTIAPLAPHVPAWLILATGCALFWRALLAWKQLALPPRWLLVLLVVASSAGVYWQFRTLFGQNPGVALLMLFMALKQLEARSIRDGFAVIFLAFFLALAPFFYGQSIPAALASIVGIVIAVATLLALNDVDVQPRLLLRRTGLMLAQAVPLMLVLFVLFPRVQGPLWALPRDAHSGTTGLSDSMTPGSISALSQSDAIAFRAHFAAGIPARRLLYWRGPVLSDFDGRTWRPTDDRPHTRLPYPEPDSGGIDYEMIIEPHNQRWLLALDLPGRVAADQLATADFQLLSKEPLLTRQRLTLRAFPQFIAGWDEATDNLHRATNLPAGSNPRLQARAAQWRTQAGSDEDVIEQAKTFFRDQRLIYTLVPPLLGEQSADEFLFDTKQGFCEHFASAFAIAMRAAGIPARVVTGYQGGEINPVDGWLIVRQYDAHAWTEVWLPGRGWQRIDPTAISAPTRIDVSLAAAVPEGDPLPLLMRADLRWLHDLRFQWEAIANTWNQWVLGYNPERQRELLRRLGMKEPDWRGMTSALSLASGLFLAALAVWAIRRRRRIDPALVLWNKISRRLARHGLARHDAEGPLAYAQRVSEALPGKADEIAAIARLYAQVRYGQLQGQSASFSNLLDELRRHVASFHP